MYENVMLVGCGIGIGTEPQKPQAVAKTMGVVGAIRAALAGNQAGNWTSDHRAESEKFTGWHYVAARALGLQFAQASVAVYDDSATGAVAAKMRRAGLRQKFGSVAKAMIADNEPATKPLLETHRLVRLLNKPNPTQSGASFRYEQAIQLSLTGVCLICKIPNGAGLTLERYVVPTAVAEPVAPNRSFPRGAFRINPSAVSQWAARADAQGFVEMRSFYRLIGCTIPAEQFVIIRWPHPMVKDDGQSAVSAGALWTDTADMIDRSRWSHLRHGPDPSLAITGPEDANLSEEDLTRAAVAFNQKYASADNHGKAFFANHGTEVTPLSTTPKDMVYDLGFNQLRDAILALHGTPAVAAGIMDGGSYAAFYASLKQYVTLTVDPTLAFVADEETIQQAGEFGSGLTIEYEAASVDDPTLVEQMLTNDIVGRIRTRNEARALRGLPPRSQPDGEELLGGSGSAGSGFGANPLIPGKQSLPQENGLGGPGSEEASTTGGQGGEFSDASRLQWKRNIKAIRDVIEGLKDGTFSETMAVVMLTSLGLSQENAQRLVDDAKDGTVDEPANQELIGGESGGLNGNEKSLRFNGHSNGHAGRSDEDWLALAVARAWRR